MTSGWVGVYFTGQVQAGHHPEGHHLGHHPEGVGGGTTEDDWVTTSFS
jgi:hypothetical protein